MTDIEKKNFRNNWKNMVRYNYTGTTYGELKECVKSFIEMEQSIYNDWLIRRSPEFKEEVRRLIS